VKCSVTGCKSNKGKLRSVKNEDKPNSDYYMCDECWKGFLKYLKINKIK